MKIATQQYLRRTTQTAFFVLFALAPVFDLLRYDLTQHHAYLFTYPWRLGIGILHAKEDDPLPAIFNLAVNLFIPFALLGILLIGASWKWGRLYCGWLCPHFGVVEVFDHLMLIASGKKSLWARRSEPSNQALTPPGRRDRWMWGLLIPLAIATAFSWSLIGLTYLMPPSQVYGGLLDGTLASWETRFLVIATTVLTVDFIFIRHLFCRYGCSVGLFQSLVWMLNPRALVIGADRTRLAECSHCTIPCGPASRGKAEINPPPPASACDAVCPMRLKPRTLKRWMFSCTQCGLCLDACRDSNANNPAGPLLYWQSGVSAQFGKAGFSAVSNTTPPSDGTI